MADNLKLLRLRAKAKAKASREREPEEDKGFLTEAKETAYDAARGAAQGATLGFADELAGAIKDPVGAAKQAASYVGYEPSEEDVAGYKSARDKYRAADEAARERSPIASTLGEIGGGLVLPVGGAIRGAKGATGLAKSAAGMGAAYGAGSDTSDTGKGMAISTGMGAALGQAGSVVSPKVARYLGNKLKARGAKQAMGATGMSGREIQRAGTDTGGELIERGVVKFGDRAEGIGLRAEKEIARASDEMTDALDELHRAFPQNPESGVSKALLQKRLDSKVAALSEDVANPLRARQVKKMGDRLVDQMPEGGVPATSVEKWKTDYGKATSRWNPEDRSLDAKKQMYLVLKDLVEEKAQKLNPEMASKFQAGKKSVEAMMPVAKAGSRAEAKGLARDPIGFKDIASGGIGGGFGSAIGGPVGGVIGAGAGIASRRLIEPRLRSMGAVSLYNIGKMLSKAPESFGRFTPMMQKAAQRGTLPVWHNLMSQKDPEYRQLMQKLGDGEE